MGSRTAPGGWHGGRVNVARIGFGLGVAAACAVLCAGPAYAQPADDDTLVGPAATDTFGGYLPDQSELTPFDVENPVVGRLDPALLRAVQDATRAAAADGVEVQINSGWRSLGFQQRLFEDGVRTYGSVDAARQFVASPQTSMHVVGRAVDVGGPDAAAWMSRNGPRFGLCQVYANELWHYELTAREDGSCPPMKPNATG
ncbi:peptidase M15 [Mycobacterium sp. GA-2829]|nr:peptidase M15 [Mycobacterium sp. GA-2829]